MSSLQELRVRLQAAYWNWVELYRSGEWKTDPEKRSAMLTARNAYLDAKADYIVTYRISQDAVQKETDE